MITLSNMKFKIQENGNLSITDDNKETIIHSDRFDLITLMKTIQDYLIDGTSVDSENNTTNYTYRYNPRSKRLEKVEE